MYNYVGSLVKLFQRKNYANSLSNLLDTGLLETRPELLERGANWTNLFDEFSPVLERPAPQCREEMSHPFLQLHPQISLLQHRPTQLHTRTHYVHSINQETGTRNLQILNGLSSRQLPHTESASPNKGHPQNPE